MMSNLFDPMLKKVRARAISNGHPFRIGMIISAGDFDMLSSLHDPLEEGWLKPIFYGNADVMTDALNNAGLDKHKCILADAIDRETRIIAMMEAVLGGGLSAICIGPDAATRNFDLLKKARADFFPVNSIGCGIAVIAVNGFERLLFVSDITMRAEPDVDQRVEIVNHCIDTALGCGVEKPRVAMLAAVEVVNPGMPVTVEAQQISEKVKREDAIIEGPVSLDLAVNMLAVQKKKATGDVPGKADCLIGSNLTVSRSIYQAAVSLSGAKAGVVLAGGSVPVALPGRADGSEGLYLSTLIATLIALDDS
ncbi:MAG: phosphate acyltransferase [Candidatus Electryonea clarkiae]|nr:phosphate acyltransferase [Candidatus Electryonea clarkiae]MDP8288551.1 phosphate acyltransferase [Candidatus Electryonea clarkiae]